MSDNTKRVILSFLIAIGLFLCGILGAKFIQHEKMQNEQITQLKNDIDMLKVKNSVDSVTWEEDNFNYLAIGNSITCHPINEYWWNECGMAATKRENDYVHQLSALLNEKVVNHTYNFGVWEVQSLDRAETLSFLDGMLSEKLDLVTIQLSENATDLNTFESDYEELIRYVQKGAPSAKVIVVGDFWDRSEKDKMKQNACNNCEVTFISLDGIKQDENYQCGIGTMVYDEDGNIHIVEHEGVAAHPNDEAMKWIAERIFEEAKNVK